MPAPRVPTTALLAALLAACGAAFLPAVDGAFQFDDFRAVQANPRVVAPARLLAETGPADLLGPGRPVTDLFLGAVRAVGGPAPRPHHLASLALHLLVAALVHRLVRRLLTRLDHPRAGPLALVVAALFAAHPLQTESVCYASQTSELLAAALGLLAVLVLLGAEDRGEAPPSRRAAAALGGAALLLLALGAKAVAVSLPAAFLLVALGSSPADGRPIRHRLGRTLLLAAPALAVAAAAVARNLVALEAGPSSAGLSAGVGPWRYLLTQARVHWLYLRLAAWPAGQSVEHAVAPSDGRLDPATLLAAAGLVALLAGAALLWRRSSRPAAPAGAPRAASRAAALGVLWWFLLLAPTSSVVPIADLAAEHRVYLALAGLLLAAVVGADALAARWLPGRRGLALAGVAVAALWGATAARAAAWRTELTLWSDAAAGNPASARAAANHAFALQQAGRLDEAAAEYARAIRLPAPPAQVAAVAMNYSAFALDRRDLASALAIADVGVAAAPEHFEVRANRALALAALGRLTEALADARACVALAPAEPFPHYVLGVALYRLGRRDEAGPAFAEAVRLGRDGTLALRPTFAALVALGRRDEACAAWGALEAAGETTPGLRSQAVTLGCARP